MQTFIFKELPIEFYQSRENILKARKLQSEADSLNKSGKAYICKFLKEERGVIVSELPIDEMVVIGGPIAPDSKEFKNDLLKISISSQNKFDAKGFQIANGVLYEQFKKPTPITNYDF